jgi:hypothetical protein
MFDNHSYSNTWWPCDHAVSQGPGGEGVFNTRPHTGMESKLQLTSLACEEEEEDSNLFESKV